MVMSKGLSECTALDLILSVFILRVFATSQSAGPTAIIPLARKGMQGHQRIWDRTFKVSPAKASKATHPVRLGYTEITGLASVSCITYKSAWFVIVVVVVMVVVVLVVMVVVLVFQICSVFN